jgi:hypothetical protein
MKRSHWILMLLCCLIPLAGIAAIVLFRIPTSSVLYFGLVLMCPLLHLVMMRSMRHDHASPSTTHVHQHGPGADGGPEDWGPILGADPRRGEVAGGTTPR